MDHEMGYAEINGARMYYETAGAGAVVVLLHAGIADQRMWDAQFEALAERYRAIRYDLRGYGQTEAPAMSYAHHEDLRALLDHLGVERAALIGCSNGGRVALNFALSYPARTSALVMVCSSPGGFKYEGEAPPLWEQIVAAFEAGDLERTSELETELWAVGRYRPPDQVDAGIRDLVKAMNLIALQKEVAGVGEEQDFAPSAVERLGEIVAPMLIVIGEVDSPAIHEAGKLMMAQIAGARSVVIPDTAHLPNMERPDEFNRATLDFLRDALNP